MTLACLTDISLTAGQRVLIRADLNVPLEHRSGKTIVADDTRIRAHLPTIRYVLEHGANAIVVSHLGRPKAGVFDERFSLAPVAECLGKLLGQDVSLCQCVDNCVDNCAGNGADATVKLPNASNASVTLCENIRFAVGETDNDTALAKQLANLCDVFVMDAFGCAHRAHASSHALARVAKQACVGPVMLAEIKALAHAMTEPERPLLVIVGGAKTETKIGMIEALRDLADEVVLGGAIANTLLVAAGHKVGRSLYDNEFVDALRDLTNDASVVSPVDFVCAPELDADASTRTQIRQLDEVGDDEMILDFGDKSIALVEQAVARAKTILWNGPLGAFELAPFARATESLARAVAQSDAYSVAGGGDTLAAIKRFGVADGISHISTGGGAFLEWIQRGDLPALQALRERQAA